MIKNTSIYANLILFLFCAQANASVYSEDGLPKLISIVDSHRQPIKNVRKIASDEQGYLWFGGDNGVFRYDGLHLIQINKQPTRGIFVDSKNNIWSFGTTKLLKISAGEFSVKMYPYIDSTNSVESNEIVYDFLETRTGALLAASDKGLKLYRPQHNRFITFSLLDKSGKSLKLYRISEGNDGSLLLGTNKGLYAINMKLSGENANNRFIIEDTLQRNKIVLEQAKNLTHDVPIRAIKSLRNGNWLIATANGLYKYSANFSNRRQLSKSNKRFSYQSVTAIEQDVLDRYWVCGSDGISIVTDDDNGDNDLYLQYSSNAEYSLSNNFVPDIYRDSEGNLLISSYSGLHYYDPSAIFPTKIVVASKSGTELTNLISIVESSKSDYWFGSFGGGLFHKTTQQNVEKTQRYLSNPNHPHSLANNRVMSLFKDFNGVTWIGSNAGLQYFDKNTGQFLRPIVKTGPALNLAKDQIMDITETGNSLWIAGSQSVYRYNRKNFALQSYEIGTDSGLDSDQWVRSILHNGRCLLVGTDRGLYQKCTGRKRFNKLADQFIIKIIEDSLHNIWVLAAAGLYRYQSNHELQKIVLPFAQETTKKDYRGASIETGCNGITEDFFEQLWLICNNQLWTYDLHNGQFLRNFVANKSFDLTDYLTGTMSMVTTDDGDIMIGMRGGLYVFRPKKIVSVETDLNLRISQISFASEEHADFGSVHGGDVLLQNNRYMTNKIVNNINLPASVKNVVFSFAIQNLVMSNRLQFEYRLKGFESRWHRAPESLRVRYSSLNAADYQFQVRVKGGNGNVIEKSYSFSVLPHWYQERLNQLSGFAIVIFLVFMIVRWRMTKLERIAIELEQKVSERTMALKNNCRQVEKLMKEKESIVENIYQQTKTPLQILTTSLDALAEDKLDREAFIEKQRHQIYQLGLLSEQVTKINEDALNIGEAIENLSVYELVNPLVNFFKDIAAEERIELGFSCDQRIYASIDPRDLEWVVQIFLENALVACQHHYRDKLTLYIERCHGYLHIKISTERIVQFKSKTDLSYGQNSVKSVNEGEGLSGVNMNWLERIAAFYGGYLEYSPDKTNSALSIYLAVVEPVEPAKIDGRESSNKGRLNIIKDHRPSAMNCNHVKPLKELVKPQQQNLNPSSYNDQSPKPSVLLVEDNEDLMNWMTELLSAEYDVFNCAQVELAMEEAIKLLPDIIIGDISKAPVDNYKLTRRIRENNISRHIPVVLVSAKNSRKNRKLALEAGANALLIKPFHADELRQMLKQQLQHLHNLRQMLCSDSDLVDKPRRNSPGNDATLYDDRVISAYLKLVSQQYANADLTVTQAAAQLHVSRRHLERKLRHYLGMSPNEYLNEYRLYRAQELLIKGESVKSVYLECGFSSQSYFARRYRLKFGRVPSKENTGATA